jgi:2-dehydro-3-deoxy-D-arabinonate dehydratase
MYLVRFLHADLGLGPRLGCLVDDMIYDVTEDFLSVASWLQASVGGVDEAIREIERATRQASQAFSIAVFGVSLADDKPYLLAPVDTQDVWAAGVTYERSRTARQEEAVDGGDVYARVYEAERPELFFKAQGRQVVGPHGFVGIRSDAVWSVPEPELALVMNPAMEVIGFTIGNDMSSRDIEGENPLYLPQAKIYTGSCAIGPSILLNPTATWPDATISMTIRHKQEVAFEGRVHTSKIKRSIPELVKYLGHSNTYPDGVVLLTGTGIVPPSDFTLAAGDEIEIEIGGIGVLQNIVKVV